MNKELEKIMNKAAEIVKDLPQKRGELVLDLQSAEAELERATARWDAMKSDDNRDRALVKWGLSMHYPKENQIVRFDSFGNLEPGQTSVALARARSQNSFSASVSAPGEVYSARRARAQAYSAPARQGESARQRLARARRR